MELAAMIVAKERGEGEAPAAWNRACRHPLLFLDDVSQLNFTNAKATGLYDLFEARSSARLVTVISCQMAGRELIAKIVAATGDHAQAKGIVWRMALDGTLILNA